jgi:hypothetical protein
METYHDAMRREESRIATEFIGTVTAKALTDKSGFKKYVWGARVDASVFDVMCETIEGNHALMAKVFRALVLCANRGTIEASQALGEMAQEYAKLNAEVDV